jgi:hypothetical protein
MPQEAGRKSGAQATSFEEAETGSIIYLHK